MNNDSTKAKKTLVSDVTYYGGMLPEESFGPLPTEADPHGKDQHEPGAKNDAGKVRVSLVFNGFCRALNEVAKVGTEGAAKYTDNGWKDVPEGIARYSDALGRHLLKENFEYIDKDFNLPHAAHAAWNALARLELILINEETNSARSSKENSQDT